MTFRFVLLLLLGLSVSAQHGTNAPAFVEAADAARKFQLMPGLKLDVWAAEPQLSNSVAFSFDPRGRVFLAQSDRWAISVFDITTHTNWLLQDMSFRTVADRAAFLSNQFVTNLTLLTRDSEVIRMVEDRDGDGQADYHVNVADGFNSVVDGTAAGVLATGTNLYFANIPNLWRFSLPDDSVPAKTKKPQLEYLLASGFGVHIGVSGHDLHGLIKGPDGRIYLSFGDRGVCLTNREAAVINLPDTGGVVRCEPDGKDLEVFCFGLRNPQELAFDDYGNLWTVDNDTAGADPCRVLHLVEGGDYGWRTSYQHMDGFGPWVKEELWRGGKDGILPPAGTVSQGPSGLAFYPGTGFGDRLKGKFLHCDFPGGVWEFSVKPLGASFEVDSKEKFLWNCWPTDVEFGPDGAAYVLDWVSGWGQTPRGRIYRISSKSEVGSRNSEVVADVKRLLGEGMGTRDEKELLKLLGHADRRVRLEAQWELAGRGARSFEGLREVAFSEKQTLPRLHSLWAIGQIARATPINFGGQDLSDELFSLIPLLEDPEAEVRGQTAEVLAAAALLNADLPIQALTKDPSARVRFQAAMAVGTKMRRTHRARSSITQKTARWLEERSPEAARILAQFADTGFVFHVGEAEILALLRDNAGKDPFIEHACIRHWVRDFRVGQESSPGSTGMFADLANARTNDSPAIRRAALLALRQLTNTYLTNFLSDPDPRLVEEAGRAIHDVPIVEGFPALASFITKIDCPTNLYSRVINACYRLGTQQHAQMLASFAVRDDVSDSARVLAVQALADWAEPGPLDRVNGLWRPLVNAEGGMRNAESSESKIAPKSNPLFERAAQAARNFGRASELPILPADLGRSVAYEEGMKVRRNPVPARRAFLRVAGDLLNPFNLTESGVPAGTREVLALQIATVEAAVKLQVREASSPFFERFANTNTAPELRRVLLPGLANLRAAQTPDAVKLALMDSDPQIRAVALPFLDHLEGEDSVSLLEALLPGTDGRVFDLRLAQAALAVLARIPGSAADAVVTGQLESLQSGTLPLTLKLDVLAASEARAKENSALATQLAQARATGPAADSLAHWDFALAGGDSTRGREIFFRNPTVQCLRCHQVGAEGGTVGPKLADIGRRYPREYLLESIVLPNAKIGAGFETVVVTLKNGESHAGLVKRETNNSLILEVTEEETGETKAVSLRKTEVERRERGLSAMPDGLANLMTPFELRDLIEYLASLQ